MPRKRNSKIPPPDRGSRVTIVDVARRAGVHWSTVSRALNPDKRHLISPDMIERVEACVRELGYRANALASGLRTQRSRTIGVIVSNLGDPVHPPIVRAIEDRFAEIGYVTLAGHHLAERGHRHIAHIAGPQNVSTGYYRCRGFRRACRGLSKLGVTPAVV